MVTGLFIISSANAQTFSGQIKIDIYSHTNGERQEQEPLSTEFQNIPLTLQSPPMVYELAAPTAAVQGSDPGFGSISFNPTTNAKLTIAPDSIRIESITQSKLNHDFPDSNTITGNGVFHRNHTSNTGARYFDFFRIVPNNPLLNGFEVLYDFEILVEGSMDVAIGGPSNSEVHVEARYELKGESGVETLEGRRSFNTQFGPDETVEGPVSFPETLQLVGGQARLGTETFFLNSNGSEVWNLIEFTPQISTWVTGGGKQNDILKAELDLKFTRVRISNIRFANPDEFEGQITFTDDDFKTESLSGFDYLGNGVPDEPDPEPENIDGHHWTNPAGGEFNNVLYWSDENENTIADDVPNSSDTAVFSLPNTYTVSLTEDQGPDKMIVTNDGSIVTLNAGEHRFAPEEIFVGYLNGDDSTLILTGKEFETNQVTLGKGGKGSLLMTGEMDFRTLGLDIKSAGSQARLTQAGPFNDEIDLGYINITGGQLVIEGFPENNVAGIQYSRLDIGNGASAHLINGGLLNEIQLTEIIVGSEGSEQTSLFRAIGLQNTALGPVSSGILGDANLYVGLSESGQVEVLNGAELDIAKEIDGIENAVRGLLHIAAGLPGEVILNGVNPTNTTRSTIFAKKCLIGALGSVGTLRIEDGALLKSHEAEVGFTGVDHQISIGGLEEGIKAEWDAGELLVNTGTIAVDTDGMLKAKYSQKSDAKLYITDGGKAEMELSSDNFNLEGFISVSGISPVTIPSTLTFDSDALFGWEDPAEIVVENGGKLKIENVGQIGIGTADNTMTINGIHPSGTRSTVEIDEFYLGGILSPDSQGDLRIEAGGYLETNKAFIAGAEFVGDPEEDGFVSPTTVTVAGSSGDTLSSWINVGTITLGNESQRPCFITLDEAEIRTIHLNVLPFGTVQGTGTLFIAGFLDNNGTVAPELLSENEEGEGNSSPGSGIEMQSDFLDFVSELEGFQPQSHKLAQGGNLTIEGNLRQGTKGILKVEVFGSEPEMQDLLIVNGDVDLGGTLEIIFSGFAPSQNDTFSLMEVSGDYTEDNLAMRILGLQDGFDASCELIEGKLTLTALTNGALRTADDPIQLLDSNYSVTSGLHISLFGIDQVPYSFESSKDMETWELISEVTGENNLLEFRSILTEGEDRRFYRVVQDPSN